MRGRTLKYLFIDTATTNLVVAIIINGKIAYMYDNNDNHDMSSKMMPVLYEAFEKSNLKPVDIDKIFVVNGPGSFTGIRVGLTVAKTMAYTLNIPIVPISSLEVMASGICGTALINARRGYVFAGTYDEDLNVLYKDSYVLMNGNLEKPYVSYDDFEFDTIKPKLNILKVILKHENDEPMNVHKLNPNYLKLTEAEEKFNHDREN